MKIKIDLATLGLALVSHREPIRVTQNGNVVTIEATPVTGNEPLIVPEQVREIQRLTDNPRVAEMLIETLHDTITTTIIRESIGVTFTDEND